jgi:hypothetical protein
MVAVILTNPSIVTGSLGKAVVVDEDAVRDMLSNMQDLQTDDDEQEAAERAEAEGLEPAASEDEEDDPAKALQDAMKPGN